MSPFGFKSMFMFAAFIYVAYQGSLVVLPEQFEVFLPDNNGSFTAFNTTRSRWLTLQPTANLDLPEQSSYAMFNAYVIGSSVPLSL